MLPRTRVFDPIHISSSSSHLLFLNVWNSVLNLNLCLFIYGVTFLEQILSVFCYSIFQNLSLCFYFSLVLPYYFLLSASSFFSFILSDLKKWNIIEIFFLKVVYLGKFVLVNFLHVQMFMFWMKPLITFKSNCLFTLTTIRYTFLTLMDSTCHVIKVVLTIQSSHVFLPMILYVDYFVWFWRYFFWMNSIIRTKLTQKQFTTDTVPVLMTLHKTGMSLEPAGTLLILQKPF